MSTTDLTKARIEAGLQPNGDPIQPNGDAEYDSASDPFDDEPGETAGRSISDRAEEEPEQEELFVLEQGKRVTLSKLINRGTPTEYRFNLNSKGIPGGDSMGLLPFSAPEMTLVVPVRAGKVVVDPTYGEGGVVEKVRITANFKPQTAYDSRSDEGRAALGLE